MSGPMFFWWLLSLVAGLEACVAGLKARPVIAFGCCMLSIITYYIAFFGVHE